MLFHSRALMSIAAATSLGALALSAAAASPSTYSGRWTVADDKPMFSTKGRFYKTLDVARCGGDVCGVSVAENGACGPTLFRFHAATLARNDPAKGHGRWGAVKKNIVLSSWTDQDLPGGRRMNINLGDGFDFGERSGNMPKYSAEYRPIGKASCIAR
jgi:hypothetical protein